MSQASPAVAAFDETTVVVEVIDVARLPPGTCGRHIVATYERLLPGESMEIVVDHDPAPLRQRFAVERPGESDWAYLEFGPRVWRVRVKRLV
jgi:uncharacterized protein (DUF2249 family)